MSGWEHDAEEGSPAWSQRLCRPSPSVHPLRIAVAIVAAFATGVLVALQTRINGDLGQRLGDGFAAAAISFGSGFVVLAVASLFWPRGRRGVHRVLRAIRSGAIPWWYAVGGAAGALFVLSQGLVAALLGVALFTVGIVAGQTVSSLLIDRRGLGAMPARRATPQRVIGALLAIAAGRGGGTGRPPRDRAALGAAGAGGGRAGGGLAAGGQRADPARGDSALHGDPRQLLRSARSCSVSLWSSIC